MKKLAFYSLLLICISLLTSALFYWVKWQTKLQPRVIECKINSSSFKIAEPILLETTLNIPLHCQAELNTFTLPEGLKEQNTGISFQQITPNSLLMKERLFPIKKGKYQDLKRELRIQTPKGTEELEILYPSFSVSQRIFDDSSEIQFYEKVSMTKNIQVNISLGSTLAIIISTSLLTCLVFFKALPNKAPGPLQIFKQQLQQFSDYQEAPDSQPLMRLQDHIRSLLAQKFDESFRSHPLKKINWDLLTEKETQLIKPILERIHESRFKGTKVAKEQFHNDIQSLIKWIEKLILEEQK